MLRRLESQGLLEREWREHEKRTKRFYQLTAEACSVALIAAAIEGIRDIVRLVNRKGVLSGWSPRRG